MEEQNHFQKQTLTPLTRAPMEKEKTYKPTMRSGEMEKNPLHSLYLNDAHLNKEENEKVFKDKVEDKVEVSETKMTKSLSFEKVSFPFTISECPLWSYKSKHY